MTPSERPTSGGTVSPLGSEADVWTSTGPRLATRFRVIYVSAHKLFYAAQSHGCRVLDLSSVRAGDLKLDVLSDSLGNDGLTSSALRVNRAKRRH
jgi:hypothetical protein